MTPTSVPWDCQYLEDAPAPLFCAYAHSPQPSAPALLVFNPLGEEGKGAFGIIGQLCAELWRAGWSVGRFDYRGTGDSAGDFAAVRPRDWLEDAHAVLRDFRDRTRPAALALLGARLGANLALAAAEDLSPAEHPQRWVFWEPVLSPDAFIRRLEWLDRKTPDESHAVDWFGWPLTRSCLDDLQTRLEFRPDRLAAPAFVANVTSRKVPARDFADLRERLPAGSRLTHVRGRPFWELIGHAACDELVDETHRWLQPAAEKGAPT